jgi:hypothetical protein
MATTRDYEQRLTNAATDLDHVRGVSTDQATRSPLARARANLQTWSGHGAGRSGYTGSRSSKGQRDLSDQVVPVVASGGTLASDEHSDALAKLDKQAIKVEHEITELRRLVDAATLTVDPHTAARTTSLDECRLCAVVGYHTVVLSRGLCDWCWRLSQRLGLTPDGQPIDPHTDLVLRHCQGKRVTENHIAQHHPIPTEGHVVTIGQDVAG